MGARPAHRSSREIYSKRSCEPINAASPSERELLIDSARLKFKFESEKAQTSERCTCRSRTSFVMRRSAVACTAPLHARSPSERLYSPPRNSSDGFDTFERSDGATARCEHLQSEAIFASFFRRQFSTLLSLARERSRSGPPRLACRIFVRLALRSRTRR